MSKRRKSLRDTLVEVCRPFDDYTNDARMEAAYYLVFAPIAELELVESDLEGPAPSAIRR